MTAIWQRVKNFRVWILSVTTVLFCLYLGQATIRQLWTKSIKSRFTLNHSFQVYLIWFQKILQILVCKKKSFMNSVESLFSYSYWILNHLLLFPFAIFNLTGKLSILEMVFTYCNVSKVTVSDLFLWVFANCFWHCTHILRKQN